ncbi:MAG: preprotein translocase subunit SecA [Candidatus Omnitrophica bacterium]|nr:preprotein translocase subunit SecA [Candidatus Omnitrophota bacterium]
MLKNFILNDCQRKINSQKPKVNIFLHKEIPTPSLKEIAAFSSVVAQVNYFEAEIKSKPDSFFKEKTKELRARFDKIKDLTPDEFKIEAEKILDEVLPYYFACVREAALRTVKMRHFDSQVLGGIVLHKNKIAEMATGEGKTLVATLAVSLNALTGKGVHVVTVNDYLARRDCEWMGPIYEFLGFSVGVIQQEMDNVQRRLAYGCDITYGTNNEFGFDYLRDNMVGSLNEMVQRGHFYAIVDEVDSILVDEARTPLIISGPAELSTEKYYKADHAARLLKVKFVIQSFDAKDGTIVMKNADGTETRVQPDELEANFDAVVEEKSNNAYILSNGEKKCERALGVDSLEETPDKFSNPWMHYLTQSLRARYLFENEQEYIIKDGKIVIVDEFTGRLMPGRRWSDGLHQAIEAKENLRIQEESQTLATITLQNYFRMYKKLAGMTGTAYTEANEFKHIYKLDTIVIPTNKALIRKNYSDRIYKNKKAKFEAVIKEIEEFYLLKQPVLVGTTSIEDSEILSFMLNKKGITHNVLNAKYHEREAHIVAQAGRLAQVTIATNMAGRGTDIILGGNIDFFIKDLLKKNEIPPEDERYKGEYEKLYENNKDKFDDEHKKVVSLGGLHVIGTQRHEARRIDNQLRGRSGRQGDPGSSRFYVSLEDDLMRLFGSEKIYFFMDKLGFPENEPIEHPLVSSSLEIAQKKVETHNFEIRKQLLEYDNVMNKQREVIYEQRRQILERPTIGDEIFTMIDEVVEKNIPVYFSEEKNTLGLTHWAKLKFDVELTGAALGSLSLEEMIEFVKKTVRDAYYKKQTAAGPDKMASMERAVALWVLDSRWKEHLLVMDSLKEGIHLRGYGQIDPLVEYQKESYAAFNETIASIKEDIVDLIFKAKLSIPEEAVSVFEESPKNYVHSEYSSLQKEDAAPAKATAEPAQQVTSGPKVGRNDPCPCGSGKKYKKCCGK